MTPITSLQEEAEPSRALQAETMARRLLWIAYCWNDHNFGPAHEHARKEAQAHGINSFEDANAWLDASVAPSHPEYRSSGEREPLTQDEIAFVLNELHSQGHGHGSSLDDFEPECPSCTAADKLKAALADGVAGTVQPQQENGNG